MNELEKQLNQNQETFKCIECGLCETRCPYNLPIRAMLKKVAKEME